MFELVNRTELFLLMMPVFLIILSVIFDLFHHNLALTGLNTTCLNTTHLENIRKEYV